MPYVRLSVHCQPEILIGKSRLCPANMHGGADRLAYLDGLVRTMQAGLADPASPLFCDVAAARRWLAGVPMANLLVDVEVAPQGVVVRERPGVRDDIAFSDDAVAICILDGRRRGATVPRYATGPDSLAIAQLMPDLTAGVDLDDLARRANLTGVDLGSDIAAGANLTGVDLGSDIAAWLVRVSSGNRTCPAGIRTLGGANLTGVDLGSDIAVGANLTGVDLGSDIAAWFVRVSSGNRTCPAGIRTLESQPCEI